MAKAKNYSNYSEQVGNVANIYQPVSEKTGEMRFSLAVHRKYPKKDGTKGEETQFLNVLVRPGRKWASQELVKKGAFLRVIGHLENNGYQAADGTWKGGMEINADKLTLIEKKENGTLVNSETGETETLTDATVEEEVAPAAEA